MQAVAIILIIVLIVLIGWWSANLLTRGSSDDSIDKSKRLRNAVLYGGILFLILFRFAARTTAGGWIANIGTIAVIVAFITLFVLDMRRKVAVGRSNSDHGDGDSNHS